MLSAQGGGLDGLGAEGLWSEILSLKAFTGRIAGVPAA
jgi:hypothetical protein